MVKIKTTTLEGQIADQTEVIIDHNKNDYPLSCGVSNAETIPFEDFTLTNNSLNQCTLNFDENFSGSYCLYFRNLFISEGNQEYKIKVVNGQVVAIIE